MRKILLAVATVSAMTIVSAPAFAQYNRADPGCSTSIGGNCGHQLDMQNATWARLHLPLEQGQGARGYYPGGRSNVIVSPGYGNFVSQGHGNRQDGGRGFEQRSQQNSSTSSSFQRHVVIRVLHMGGATPQPVMRGMSGPENAASLPQALEPQHQAAVPVDNAPSWLHVQRQ